VWSALYTPFGGAYTLSGSETLNARFPGQWFQLEAGLHYNWHRHYDPSLGRYTQPDPLGFVDGPAVYVYAGSSPLQYVDKDGRQFRIGPGLPNTFPRTPAIPRTPTIPRTPFPEPTPPHLDPKPPVPGPTFPRLARSA